MFVAIKLLINIIFDYWNLLIEKYGMYWAFPTFVIGGISMYFDYYNYENYAKIFFGIFVILFGAFVVPANSPPPPDINGDCSEEGIQKRKKQELKYARNQLAEERKKLLTMLKKH